MTLSDLALQSTIQLVVPLGLGMSVLGSTFWRSAKVRGLSSENYRSKIDESVTDTLVEQISEILKPLLDLCNVVLP